MQDYDLNGHARQCPHCQSVARFTIIQVKGTVGTHWVTCEEADLITIYGLYECTNCHHAIMMVYEVVEELSVNDPPIRRYVLKHVFPSSDVAVAASLPPEIREDLEEACVCIKAGAFKAAVVMCRRVVEGVCQDKNVRPGPLPQRLRALKDQLGLITDDILAWAEEIKELGNAGAHADRRVTVTLEDAKDALDFVQAILNVLYVLPERLSKRKHREAIP